MATATASAATTFTPLHDRILVRRIEEGETVQCEECGTDLEIISNDPLEIAPVEESGYHDESDEVATDEDEDE